MVAPFSLMAPIVTPAREPRRDQFRVGIDRGPGPHVASIRRGFFGARDVLLLRVDECPDFIDLNALAGEVPKHAVLIPSGGLAGINHWFTDSPLARSG
jgi:hypothetical protein